MVSRASNFWWKYFFSSPFSAIRDTMRQFYAGMNKAAGAINVFNGVLSDSELQELQDWADSVECNFGRESRNWEEGLTVDFEDVKISELYCAEQGTLPPQLEPLYRHIREYTNMPDNVSVGFMVYRWQRMSGIGTHSDGHCPRAFTFHLCKEWKQNWGGEFIFFESESDKSAGRGGVVEPRPNRLVINNSHILHRVAYTSTTAPERVTIQGFEYTKQA